MDPKKHPLVEVEELLDILQPASPGMYLLYAYKEDINCCHCNLAPKDAVPIARIRSDDINDGFTTRMWERIEAKIRIYLKQGVLKWKPQKP